MHLAELPYFVQIPVCKYPYFCPESLHFFLRTCTFIKFLYLFIKELETETRGASHHVYGVWYQRCIRCRADTRCHPIACVGSRGLGHLGGAPTLNYKHRHQKTQGGGHKSKKERDGWHYSAYFDIYWSPQVVPETQRKLYLIMNQIRRKCGTVKWIYDKRTVENYNFSSKQSS